MDDRDKVRMLVDGLEEIVDQLRQITPEGHCWYCGTSMDGMSGVVDVDGDPVCDECVDSMTDEERAHLLPEGMQ